MSERKYEIRKVYSEYECERRSTWWRRLFWPKTWGLKVVGYDYLIDGVQAAASRWDGQKMVTVVMPGYDGLFGLKA